MGLPVADATARSSTHDVAIRYRIGGMVISGRRQALLQVTIG